MNKKELVAAINAANESLKVTEDLSSAQLNAIHDSITLQSEIESQKGVIAQLEGDLAASEEALEKATDRVISLENATKGTLHIVTIGKTDYQVKGGARLRSDDGVITKYTAAEIAENPKVAKQLLDSKSQLIKKL